MRLPKPHRAAPARPGAALRYLGTAAAAGLVAGLGSAALTGEGRATLFAAVKPVAVAAGVIRAREPQAGDVWRGCDDARAAGTAPIHAGEPGYREGMDGDGDGIACEPYR